MLANMQQGLRETASSLTQNAWPYLPVIASALLSKHLDELSSTSMSSMSRRLPALSSSPQPWHGQDGYQRYFGCPEMFLLAVSGR
jgi:hypothetical protein